MKKMPEEVLLDKSDQQNQNNIENESYRQEQQRGKKSEQSLISAGQPHKIDIETLRAYQQQQDEYDQYGLYDEYGGDLEILDENIQNMDYKISSEGNAQCEMQDLVKIINKETFKIMQLTGFDEFWAIIYYQACGWRMNLVSSFIDQKLTSHKMISFKPGSASMSSMDGMCDVCCLENKIIYKNMCGDEFCEDCWKSHLKQKLRTFNTEPFPPCLNSQCKVRSSPFILTEIGKSDPEFKILYLRTLCRSYAIGNTSVKMCKGRQGVSCDRCFKVNKMFELIECEFCQNIVCGRCGDEYHFPSECFDGPNWRKIVEGSTSFIQNLNYRICPSCKQAVERSVGCNSMVCKCKQNFCYTCGQKWLPNHDKHGVCYRQKEIRSLQEQNKRKRQNEKEYIDKLQKFKAEIEKYVDKIKKVDGWNVEQIKTELISRFKVISNELDYLQRLKTKLRIALRIAKGYVLTLYFNDNEVSKASLSSLVLLIQQGFEYLIYELKNLIVADSGEGNFTKQGLLMRKKLMSKEIIPQQYLSRNKINMLEIIKRIDKHINAEY